MSEPETFVKNASLVTDKFSRWPQFHDAEVVRLMLDRDERRLAIELKSFEMMSKSDINSFGHRGECIIALSFSGLSDLELFGFNHQNVLSALNIKEDDGAISVVLDGIFGLSGRFRCDDVEVIEVTPVGRGPND